MEYSLSNADQRLLSIVWEAQPIPSPALCKLALERLGWKRTTTYTVLRRLCDKGILQNQDTVVTALVEQQQVQQAQGRQVLEQNFSGSLPQFVAAFLNSGSLSEQEAREIQRMLDDYRKRI